VESGRRPSFAASPLRGAAMEGLRWKDVKVNVNVTVSLSLR